MAAADLELVRRELAADEAEDAGAQHDVGEGNFKAKMAMNEAAASAQSTLFFSARVPMRQAANTTMATTAGLMPLNTPCTKVTSPKAR
jgi:hypothetical protein